jgi:hypothetical protein
MQIMKDFIKNSISENFGTSRSNASKSVGKKEPVFRVEHEMHSLKGSSPQANNEYGEQ